MLISYRINGTGRIRRKCRYSVSRKNRVLVMRKSSKRNNAASKIIETIL
jgi:hypothetical protein